MHVDDVESFLNRTHDNFTVLFAVKTDENYISLVKYISGIFVELFDLNGDCIKSIRIN